MPSEFTSHFYKAPIIPSISRSISILILSLQVPKSLLLTSQSKTAVMDESQSSAPRGIESDSSPTVQATRIHVAYQTPMTSPPSSPPDLVVNQSGLMVPAAPPTQPTTVPASFTPLNPVPGPSSPAALDHDNAASQERTVVFADDLPAASGSRRRNGGTGTARTRAPRSKGKAKVPNSSAPWSKEDVISSRSSVRYVLTDLNQTATLMHDRDSENEGRLSHDAIGTKLGRTGQACRLHLMQTLTKPEWRPWLERRANRRGMTIEQYLELKRSEGVSKLQIGCQLSRYLTCSQRSRRRAAIARGRRFGRRSSPQSPPNNNADSASSEPPRDLDHPRDQVVAGPSAPRHTSPTPPGSLVATLAAQSYTASGLPRSFAEPGPSGQYQNAGSSSQGPQWMPPIRYERPEPALNQINSMRPRRYQEDTPPPYYSAPGPSNSQGLSEPRRYALAGPSRGASSPVPLVGRQASTGNSSQDEDMAALGLVSMSLGSTPTPPASTRPQSRAMRLDEPSWLGHTSQLSQLRADMDATRLDRDRMDSMLRVGARGRPTDATDTDHHPLLTNDLLRRSNRNYDEYQKSQLDKRI